MKSVLPLPLVAKATTQMGVVIRRITCLSHTDLKSIKVGVPTVFVCHYSLSRPELETEIRKGLSYYEEAIKVF